MKLSISQLFLSSSLLFSHAILSNAMPSPNADTTVLTRNYYGGTCPTCIPFPGENKCDITTSCVYVWGHTGSSPAPNYCACRAGYRGDGVKPYDTSSQFRLPWASQQGRVFVKPGVVCNTLCDNWQLGKDGCKEVPVANQCF